MRVVSIRLLLPLFLIRILWTAVFAGFWPCAPCPIQRLRLITGTNLPKIAHKRQTDRTRHQAEYAYQRIKKRLGRLRPFKCRCLKAKHDVQVSVWTLSWIDGGSEGKIGSTMVTLMSFNSVRTCLPQQRWPQKDSVGQNTRYKNLQSPTALLSQPSRIFRLFHHYQSTSI